MASGWTPRHWPASTVYIVSSSHTAFFCWKVSVYYITIETSKRSIALHTPSSSSSFVIITLHSPATSFNRATAESLLWQRVDVATHNCLMSREKCHNKSSLMRNNQVLKRLQCRAKQRKSPQNWANHISRSLLFHRVRFQVEANIGTDDWIRWTPTMMPIGHEGLHLPNQNTVLVPFSSSVLLAGTLELWRITHHIPREASFHLEMHRPQIKWNKIILKLIQERERKRESEGDRGWEREGREKDREKRRETVGERRGKKEMGWG